MTGQWRLRLRRQQAPHRFGPLVVGRLRLAAELELRCAHANQSSDWMAEFEDGYLGKINAGRR